jgi:hypothetical protein
MANIIGHIACSGAWRLAAAMAMPDRVRVQACVIGMTLQRAAGISPKPSTCLRTAVAPAT